ncbi:hypothetical protein [Nocardioides campestrisoli]|uniref:hypothetical protein n=1 Tax=Nocardioides campestrisoli TaxID=2736757 RepID=UPI0015E6E00F|nr:hypothetical protein [Nocardioides campestrisoli]
MNELLVFRVGALAVALCALWVFPEWDTYRTRALRTGQRWGVLPPQPEMPHCPPVEQALADADRIRADLRHAPAGTPVARLRGWLEAYDDVLLTVCHSLEYETRLGSLPWGVQRELERERVERMLVHAGLLSGADR